MLRTKRKARITVPSGLAICAFTPEGSNIRIDVYCTLVILVQPITALLHVRHLEQGGVEDLGYPKYPISPLPPQNAPPAPRTPRTPVVAVHVGLLQ